jgi:hypothetical protein
MDALLRSRRRDGQGGKEGYGRRTFLPPVRSPGPTLVALAQLLDILHHAVHGAAEEDLVFLLVSASSVPHANRQGYEGEQRQQGGEGRERTDVVHRQYNEELRSARGLVEDLTKRVPFVEESVGLFRPLILISTSPGERRRRGRTSHVAAVYRMCVNSLSSFRGQRSRSFGGTWQSRTRLPW